MNFTFLVLSEELAHRAAGHALGLFPWLTFGHVTVGKTQV